MQIQVGTLAVATKQTAVSDFNEIGVCYEVYELDGRPGYSFIFERGGYDGFSLDEVTWFLRLQNVHCIEVSGYEFRNVLKLCADFRAGFFLPAFKLLSPI